MLTIIVALTIILLPVIIYSRYRDRRNGPSSSSPSSQSSAPVLESGDPARTTSPKKQAARYEPKSYAQVHRQDGVGYNLNYDTYTFSARYIETNRMRKNRSIRVFIGTDVKDEIIGLGYAEPIEYNRVDPEPPTEKQIAYLQDLTENAVPDDLSLPDASALISRIVDYDRIPNPQLLEYATQMRVPVSYYIGKKRLYDSIFASIPERERSVFFVFCVYRSLAGDYSVANPLSSPHHSAFCEFADLVDGDASFQKSLSQITGSQLRFFGSRSVNGNVINGASKNTIAYKKAAQFLRDKGICPL